MGIFKRQMDIFNISSRDNRQFMQAVAQTQVVKALRVKQKYERFLW